MFTDKIGGIIRKKYYFHKLLLVGLLEKAGLFFQLIKKPSLKGAG